MIVVDTSVVIDFLLQLPPFAVKINDRIIKEVPLIMAPHLLDAEVGQVLRRFVRQNKLSHKRAMLAFADLQNMPIIRYEHLPLLSRAFKYRDNVTFYDAIYLALAESINAPFLTRDKALAAIPGCKARVELFA
ncbi:MAG: type II toxin-antitoxin system VapC family toxin [Deltaproteobacteria bacterium]|nr:type II toxin-antitoxin system VapC family toxin [Deltaproteobacteria bacterium]